MKRFLGTLVLVLSACWCAFGEEAAKSEEVVAKSAEELAVESEAYCVETEKDAASLTPKMVIDKVNSAAALLVKDGKGAFAKFKGKGSEYIFGGTYIWIHDINGVMQMHPVKPKMEGKQLLGLKDENGKLFFVEMNNLVKEKGSGWVIYVWPKPGAEETSPKVSYVKLVKVGEEELVVGCGVYDWTMEKVETESK